jgi:phytoene/squalene synthetase
VNQAIGEPTANLARSITWRGSKQTYFTARLMVDKALVDDCYRAYGYFRWADDLIDVSSKSSAERIAFITRQRALIESLYRNDRPDELTAEEEIIADLIENDRGEYSGLESFIRNFLAVIEFDAHRKGRLITEDELAWYSNALGKSVTDCIQYFVGNGHPYPDHENRYLAATAAHITHMLRDMSADLADGFINVPREVIEELNISLENIDDSQLRGWVQDRVEQARGYFHQGKQYLDGLDVLRCKLVGYWYCARFEGTLDTIERDGYVLRTNYNERRKLSTWLKIAGLSVSVTFKHLLRRAARFFRS